MSVATHRTEVVQLLKLLFVVYTGQHLMFDTNKIVFQLIDVNFVCTN